MAIDLKPAPDAGTAPADTRRDEVAIAFFGTWMIIGLFLDGWAHQTNKPESFFSPWHGVLYSGFAAANVFFAWAAWRERRSTNPLRDLSDRLVAIGLVVFSAGAFGDFVWHEIFGVEVDLETLLSPTHLALMVGGLLMVTGPVRMAWRRFGQAQPSRRAFFPTLVCVTLATALGSFFLMYLSAFNNPGIWGLASGSDPGEQVGGVATILVTNAILLSSVLVVLRRWIPPFGSFAFMFGMVATLMSGLHAFDQLPLVGAALIGGLTTDALVARRTSVRALSAIVPGVMWSTWFAVFALAWGLSWTPELWTGTIILAAVSGVGLSVLAFPPAVSRSA